MSSIRWRPRSHAQVAAVGSRPQVRAAATRAAAAAAAAATLAVALVSVFAAVPAVASAKTKIFGSGSSAAEKYVDALIAGYKKVQPNVSIVYTADGGNQGVEDVQKGKSQFAIQTAAPVLADAGTVFAPLFYDGLCIDVNSANRLSSLSVSAVSNVFTGVDTSWSQVSGSGLGATILPEGREASAGQYTFFEKAVLKGASPASDVTQLSSDGLVANAIVQSPGAIGYVGLANSALAGERALKIGGIACTAKEIKIKRYPLRRVDYGVLRLKHESVAAAKFLDWARTSAAAGKILAKSGAVAEFNK